MEHTMASKPITYQAEPETPAPHGFAASSIGKLVAFAPPRPWSLSAWFGTVAARCARAIATEVRIRRDTRQLMLMSDEMLKDIGLSRTQIHGAVRFGRE
jgi:uncharacterized protein YjiS (DUF1127 family)